MENIFPDLWLFSHHGLNAWKVTNISYWLHKNVSFTIFGMLSINQLGI